MNTTTVPIGGQILVGARVANIDANYGPWESLQAAYTVLTNTASITEGLTIGIIEEGRIVEYWFQGGTALENLVKKTRNIIDLSKYDADFGRVLPALAKDCEFEYDGQLAYSVPVMKDGNNYVLVYVYAMIDGSLVNKVYLIQGNIIRSIWDDDEQPDWVSYYFPEDIARRIRNVEDHITWETE